MQQKDRDGSKEQQLRQYLRRRAENGEFYCKSKYIADDVGLSAKQIGALMGKLRRADTPFDIEKWGYTGATTWHIVPE